ncbi:MAG: hypothetical protein BroJett040_08880 [Oligoflexia bacterium]|nr:MAG: hypothetical protein BroJett040_08880 [Oligoflexia bacterium]
MVQRIGLVLACVFFIACQKKTSDTVFTEYSKKQSDSCASTRIQSQFLVEWETGDITVEHATDAQTFKETFVENNLHLIKRVEFNKRIQMRTDSTTLSTTATDVTWGQTMIEAQAVWDQGVKGQGIKVAVVDAGIDYFHPQIFPQLDENAAERNGASDKDDDGNGLVDDQYGWDFAGNQPDPMVTANSGNDHGSHVAGIILADHESGPMKGVAPQAKLVPVNFMDAHGGGDLATAIKAVKYAASRGVRVINASWGGPVCSDTLRDTIRALADQNILFVAAAGNEGLDLDIHPDYPANFTFLNQLTVGASRNSDKMATWSNNSFNFVQLAAPGDTILSTVPGGYAYMSGTSMAAPFVSGAAALLWSARPGATFQQIRQALLSGVDVRDYRVQTRGRLNAKKALEELKKLVP